MVDHGAEYRHISDEELLRLANESSPPVKEEIEAIHAEVQRRGGLEALLDRSKESQEVPSFGVNGRYAQDRPRPTVSPWISIWTRPRETMRWVLNTDPKYNFALLVVLAGFAASLDRASVKSMGDKYSLTAIFLIAAVVGPIGWALSIYLFGALITWTGKWMGGKARREQVRAALAWGTAPRVWALLLWVPAIALFGSDMFTTATPAMDARPLLAFAFLLLTMLVGTWSVVIFLKCLGEAQGFSAWRALGNMLIAFLILFVPILGITVGFLIIFDWR